MMMTGAVLSTGAAAETVKIATPEAVITDFFSQVVSFVLRIPTSSLALFYGTVS